ncbi:MAG: hypothetical protein ACR2QM_10165 [Longimicrobiales bacterium]
MTTGTSARAISVGLLFAVLAAGFFMGAAWDSESASATTVELPAETPRDGGRALVIDQVGLEDDQRAQVDEIVEYFQAEMRELNHEFRQAYRPRERKLLDQTRDSIKSVLSPQQVITYDSLLEARYGDRNDEQSRRGRGDGGRN